MNTPRQYDLHHKPDNYRCILEKEASKSKSSKRASSSRSSARSETRRDVPQLGQQAKKSIPPLNVLSEAFPQLVMQQGMEEAAQFVTSMGVTIADLLSSQDDNLPKAAVVWKYVIGQPLVTKEEWDELPTHMRALDNWYMSEILVVPERKWLVLDVPYEYYYREDKIHIEFSELYQLFHFDAIEKTLMSCYCL